MRRLPSGRNAASAASHGLDERMNAAAVAALDRKVANKVAMRASTGTKK